jgi:hypothetical protein
MWIIRHPKREVPFLKIVPRDEPLKVEWTEKINEAYQYDNLDEAHHTATVVAVAHQWPFAILQVEEYVTYAVKVHDAEERRSVVVKVPNWVRRDPLQGNLYLVPRLLDASLFETQDEAEAVAVAFVGRNLKHLGKAEVRRVTGSILSNKMMDTPKQRLRTGKT